MCNGQHPLHGQWSRNNPHSHGLPFCEHSLNLCIRSPQGACCLSQGREAPFALEDQMQAHAHTEQASLYSFLEQQAASHGKFMSNDHGVCHMRQGMIAHRQYIVTHLRCCLKLEMFKHIPPLRSITSDSTQLPKLHQKSEVLLLGSGYRCDWSKNLKSESGFPLLGSQYLSKMSIMRS